MPTGLGINCYTKSDILDKNGIINNNLDGSISIFIPNQLGQLEPLKLSYYCCTNLDPTYFFDANTQKCMWKKKEKCSIQNEFNISLNPSGNDGVIFVQDENQVCKLNVSFDYLFKIKCETLNELLQVSQNQVIAYSPEILAQITTLQFEIQQQSALCESLTNTIITISSETKNTPYSVVCNEVVLPNPTTSLPSTGGGVLSNTGFGNQSQVQIAEGAQGGLTPVAGLTFCIQEPVGLNTWANILGPVDYQNFLSGDPNSYDCNDVLALFNQSNATVALGNTPLLVKCSVPFGSRTRQEEFLNNLLTQQTDCFNTLQNLQQELITLTATQATQLATCSKPIDMFESLDVSMTLSYSTGNTYIDIYEDANLFPAIGVGNLYNYLVSNNSISGFYVCSSNDCTPMNLNLSNINSQNTEICDLVANNIIQDLFLQSGFPNSLEGIDNFKSTISDTAFNSSWLNFSTTIEDPIIISAITNNKVKVNLKLNHSCGDICILLDNIKLDKVCDNFSTKNTFISKCPGFELEKIRDNKKSWLNNSSLVNRNFSILDVNESNGIRQTDYDIKDERLIINTKEIDLDINIAAAIETDVWSYIVDNPCLLTGQTTCNPCISACCGDNQISLVSLSTQPLTAITVVEDFEYYLISEYIDAKNRQTISGYPTLRAIYDRYLNSSAYCQTNSSAFDYFSIEQFAGLIENYWVDIIEQVIPSTTIWGSVKVYTNTIFDEQKFKYKSYTSLLCGNPFFGRTISSPINKTSGLCETVEVKTTQINLDKNLELRVYKNVETVCDKICVAQMNHGSEFIGTVTIMGEKPISCEISGPLVTECSIGVEIIKNGLTVTASVVNALNPVSYSWSNGGTEQTTTFPSQGFYSITVTDANCCSVTQSFKLE